MKLRIALCLLLTADYRSNGFSGYPISNRLRTRCNNLYMSAVEEDVKRNEEIRLVRGHELRVSQDGIYQIANSEEHGDLLSAFKDKIVVLKLFAPWCRACKGLAPKFIMLSKDKKLQNVPVVFAEMSIVGNKEFLKGLGVLALPSVQFYCKTQIVENFPCGPSKFTLLKKKLVITINERVDATTRQLKSLESVVATEPCKERDLRIGDYVVDPNQLDKMRHNVPYFKHFTDEEFEQLISKATLQSFEPQSVIFRQGQPGHLFYVIESGECEVSARTGLEDPLTTPPSYLGAVINVLPKNAFFGERSLITGEPRVATIRAIEKTRCIVIQQQDIPSSSVLSGEVTPTKENLEDVNEKYNVDPTLVQKVSNQVSRANILNQSRGSVNSPRVIPDKYEKEDFIIPLLIRFKRVRQAQKCFDYMSMKNNQLFFDDIGQSTRRSMLVSRLPTTTYQEFEEIWKLLDKNNDGKLSLLEMKRFMENTGQEKTTDELQEIVQESHPDLIVSSNAMSFSDFMGIMAEAEFYYLFLDTFKALDKNQSGFVRIGDLNQILCGMMDLVCDTKTNIIDMNDEDMLIDYEQYSKMLLGANAIK